MSAVSGDGSNPTTDPTSLSAATEQVAGSQLSSQDTNFLLVVFLALLGSVSVTQSLASTVSQMIQDNASMQDTLNQQIEKFLFEVMPSGAKTNTINQVNEYNQNVQFERQNLQAIIITLRQKGQTGTTEAQVMINYLQQNSTELTAILKIMVVIMQLINQVANPSS